LSLAPDHLADLRASGLTDSTITALRFTSLCPSDIPVRRAQSAYAIPYFNPDGSVNCHKRVKLIPTVKDADGHTQKYWQPPGSQPGLYLPPSFFNWDSVARNPKTSLTITEGEKKAGAGCQQGMITVLLGCGIG
jgi:putative DNA primase/helicase